MLIDNRHFRHWNYTTACCFKYKTRCAECPNDIVCKQIKDFRSNEYNIHPAKYAMLRTYAIAKDSYTTGLNKRGSSRKGWTFE